MSDRPDEVIVHKADKCTYCLKSLRTLPLVEIQRKQVFEIPPVKLKVTEHQSEVNEHMFDHTISQGTIKNINERLYNNLEMTTYLYGN